MYVSAGCQMYFLVLQEVEPDDLLVARHVAGQVDQPYHRRRPRQPHRPYVQPVHRVLHEAEDVLHATPRLRLAPVRLPLLLGQRMAPVALLAYLVLHLVLLQCLLLTHMRAVAKQRLALVRLLKQRVGRLGVVHRGWRDLLRQYQLALRVALDVVLVAVVVLPALLRPARLRVLVTLLVGLPPLALLGIPQPFSFASLDALVLVGRVALPRNAHEARVNHAPLVEYQPLAVQVVHEPLEQVAYLAAPDQTLAEQPYRPRFGYAVTIGKAQEAAERGAVHYLVLRLLVAQVVVPLQYHQLEHHHHVVALRARVALALLRKQRVLQLLAEQLEVHHFRQPLQWVAHL